MPRVTIDGASHSGNYRGYCQCGDTWSGQGERLGAAHFSPLMPIAEAVVHVRLCHEGQRLELEFASRFSQWLLQHWERAEALRSHSIDQTVPHVGR